MPSRYRNFRHSVPWLILFLEAVFLVFSYFFLSDAATLGLSVVSYPAFQDVNHMVIFGFGFFLVVLRRYGFSSTGFNLLIMVLGVQYSVLTDYLLDYLDMQKNENGLTRITKATMSMTAVAISTGAVLGKSNPLQLIVMAIVELITFSVSRRINKIFLEVLDSISMMHVHLFGAYFGLAVTSRFPEPSPRLDKNRNTPTSDLWSMLGTVFLWVFWPSFNSILVRDANKVTAAYNTYFALAVSAVIAFAFSVLTTKDGKFQMAHIHSAVLAGGVTIGYTAQSIQHPWNAMVLGLLASVIAIAGSHCSQSCLNPPLKIHDTSGVHFTFALPAVLGALAQVALLLEDWTHLTSPGYLVLIHLGAFCQTIAVALIAGLITGLILNLKLFKIISSSKYFDDQFYWEFPHLSVGY
ncbi:PREDICTED: RH-like protein [Acanthisitta chloris]|uniref:RH-like protein n=1 Tax=Acanthisitta chloris TaxID=57068 RepID=UPI0004F0E691|nr:PREDICTED: RH-like protein [Acanthisitta chloris]KFP70215.1 Blood group Rh(D) polypeptide [Acanthisitta chloris]